MLIYNDSVEDKDHNDHHHLYYFDFHIHFIVIIASWYVDLYVYI